MKPEIVEEDPNLFWRCRICGNKENANRSSCSSCGYARTQFDLSKKKSSTDTGKFEAVRLTQPSFSEIARSGNNFSKKIVLSFAVGTVLALAIISLLVKC